MAEETVLIDIKIEASAALARQAELKTKLNALQQSQSELAKSVGKTSEAYIANDAQIATVNQQLRNNGTVLKQVALNSSEVSGAYAVLNKSAAEAAQKAKDMSVAYGVNDVRTKAAVESSNALSNQLKETDKSLGQGKRDVGLYGDALSKFKGNLDIIPTSLGGLQNGLKATATGFMGVIKQMWLMVANPIGAVIAAIAVVFGILYLVFKDFKPVVDKVEQSFSALGAVFEVIKNSIIGLLTGTKSLSETFSSLGGTMNKAASEAANLKRAQQELEDSQAGIEVQNKRAETQIQKLILQSKNRTLSEKERIALIDKAVKLEEEAFQRSKKQNDEAVRIAENKIIIGKALTANEIKRLKTEGVAYARKLQEDKQISDEEIDALTSVLLAREDINQKSTGLQEKAQNRRDALEDAATAKEEKRQEKIVAANEKAAAAKEKIAEKTKALQDKRDSEEKAATEKLASFKLKTLKENADADIQTLNDNLELIKLKQEERLAGQILTDKQLYDNKQQALIDSTNNEATILDTKLINQQITQEEFNRLTILNQQKLNTALAVNDAEFSEQKKQMKLDAAALDFQNDLQIAQLKNQQTYDLQSQALEAQMILEVSAAEKSGADVTLVKIKYALLQDDLEKKKRDANLNALKDFATNVAGIFGKNTVVSKAAASAAIAIDTYKGAIAAFNSMQALPFGLGVPVGIAAAAAVTVKGGKAIKDVWAVKSGLPGDGGGGGGGQAVSNPASGASTPSVTGGLVSRQSGQVEQMATTKAVTTAMQAAPTQTVLVTNDLTIAQNEKVQLKTNNSL